MGPENALVMLYSFIVCGTTAYTLYHILTTQDIAKILIGLAFTVGMVVLLIRQIKKNIVG